MVFYIKMTLTFIFNADDFGRSSEENQKVASVIAGGIVKSVTVMANFSQSIEVQKLKKDAPELGVGVHLNVTEGSPVLSLHRVRSILSENGTFLSKKGLLRRLTCGKISFNEVRLELVSQIDKMLDLVGRVSHIDSHQNIHLFPGIAESAAFACKLRGITKVRSQREITVPRIPGGFKQFFHLLKAAIRTFGQNKLEKLGLRSPAPILTGIPGYGQGSTDWQIGLSWWKQYIPLLRPGIYEICLHPGCSPAEVKLYTSDEFKTYFFAKGYNSLSFNDV